MSIKDILLQVDPGPAYPGRLDLAAGLARQHGAHLTGLFVFDLGLAPAMPFGLVDPESTTILARHQAQLREDALAAASDLRAGFQERLRRDGIDGEWRLVEGRAVLTLALHARYADLAILGQEDPDDPQGHGWAAAVEQALFSSGRPVLVVPYAGRFAQVGRRVLIGWNARREAARAVHDALPLIRDAAVVTVVAVDPHGRPGALGGHGDDHGDEPAADIARHLARHGLRVTAAQTDSGGIGVADVLLNQAADLGADLLVTGGYGHSRTREMVLGGVTRALLQRMTLPVLMSH